MIKNGKMMKKLRNIKHFIFPSWRLVAVVENWRDEKPFYLNWEEKWEDEKHSLYKFTFISLFDKKKKKFKWMNEKNKNPITNGVKKKKKTNQMFNIKDKN